MCWPGRRSCRGILPDGKACTKLGKEGDGDGEMGKAMWPRRTFVRRYRLRLVTFEPAKLRKAIPISVCAREGLTGVIPSSQDRRGAHGYNCLILDNGHFEGLSISLRFRKIS